MNKQAKSIISLSIIVLIIIGIFFIFLVSANTNVSSCRDLNISGMTYVLTQSVSSASTCFNILNSSVTLDCAGYTITETSTNYGVEMNSYNGTVIKNCIIAGGNYGIHSGAPTKISNWTIINNTINSSTGMYFTSGGIVYSGMNISGNILRPTTGNGISIDGGTSDSTFNSNNIITLGTAVVGINLATTFGSLNITNNIINSTGTGISITNIISPGLNYSNISGNIINSSNGLGINIVSNGATPVENSIISNNNILSSSNGFYLGSGAFQKLNIFGNKVTSTAGEGFLTAGSFSDSIINSNNITTITGNNPGFDMNSAFGSVNMTNNIINSTGTGIIFTNIVNPGINNSNMSGNTIFVSTSGKYGIYAASNRFANTKFSRNTISTNNGEGIHIYCASAAQFNNITNNIISVTSLSTSSLNGIYTSYFQNSSISGNTVTGYNVSNGRGIYAEYTTGVSITKNTLKNNSYGIWIDGTATSNQIGCNNIYSNTLNLNMVPTSATTTISRNYWGHTNRSLPCFFVYGGTNSPADVNQDGMTYNDTTCSYVENPCDVPNSCGIISSSGTYTMTQNLQSTGTCFQIQANNIIFNGANYNITGTNTGMGINASSTSNVTIQNFGTISNFAWGVYSYVSSGNKFINMTLKSNAQSGLFYSSTINAIASGITTLLNSFYGIDMSNGANNTFSNIIANNNTYYGIYSSASNNNTYSNITSNYNGYYGLDIYTSSYNNFTNIISSNNSQQGIYLYSSSENNFTNAIADSNGQYGVYTYSSSENNRFSNATLTNSGTFYDLFDNLVKTYFTNSLIMKYDLINVRMVYEKSLYGKIEFLMPANNIGTNISNDIIISNNFAYVNASISGLNKSANVSLYNLPTNFVHPVILRNGVACPADICYNFTSLNAGNVTFNVTSWSNYSIGEGTVSGCGLIDTPGYYNITQNLNSAGTCFNITSSNVFLEGNGFNIIGNTSGYAVVSTSVSNVTVNNFGLISNFSYAIYLIGTNSSLISNMFINGSTYGIEVTGTSTNNIFSNIIANGNSQMGVRINSNSNGNTLSNITANNNSAIGIYFLSNSNNTIINSTTNNNQYGINIASSSNNTIFNIIAINNIYNGIGLGSGSRNNVSNIIVNNSQYGIQLTSNSNNNIISNIITTNNSMGIYADSNVNNTFLNITASRNSLHGIYLTSSLNNNFLGITVSSNTQYGIYVTSSSNNNIISGIISNSNSRGIYVLSSSNTTISNVNASSNTYGVYITSSSNNTLYNINSSNNLLGFSLSISSNNILYNIEANSNSQLGIDLSSSNNILSNITTNNNAWYGILVSNNNNTFSNITTNYNGLRGFYLSTSANNILNNINANYNIQYGIYINGSSNNNLLSGISASNNLQYGVYVINNNNNSILNMIVNNNSLGGILISSSLNDTISNITTNKNGIYGIYISSSSNDILTNITANNNIGTGIYLDGTNRSILSNIVTNNNTNNGIYLYTGSNNNNLSNINSSNNTIGIYVYLSHYSILSNIISNNNSQTGISISSSNNGILSRITSNNNLQQGFFISSSSNNTFSNLIANANNQRGITISSSSNNTIANIISNGNSQYGILVSASLNNNFTNVTSINSPLGDLYVTSGSNSTYLIDSNFNNYTLSNPGSLIYIKSTLYGEIKFIQPINGTNSNLSSDVVINYNFAYVNSSQTGLNQSANVSLYNIPTNFTNPAILKDGVICPANICYNFTNLNAGNVSFNVTSWSNYTIGEGKATPILTFLVNGGTSNLSIEYPGTINLSVFSTCGTPHIFYTTTDITFLNNIDFVMPVGNYIFYANVTGSSNCTDLGNTYYNISIIDTTSPTITIIPVSPVSPTTYAIGKNYTYTANVYDIASTIDTVYLMFNGTNYTAANIAGSLYGKTLTDLASGTYNYSWWANDSVGNINYTQQYTYVIDKNNSIVNLYLNSIRSNLEIKAGNYVNITAIKQLGEGNILLYKDGILINNGTNILYNNTLFNSIGNYNITTNYLETQNYTSTSESYTVIVTTEGIVIVNGNAGGAYYMNTNTSGISLYNISIDTPSDWSYDTIYKVIVKTYDTNNSLTDIKGLSIELTNLNANSVVTQTEKGTYERIFSISNRNITKIEIIATASDGYKSIQQIKSISLVEPTLSKTLTDKGKEIAGNIGNVWTAIESNLFVIIFSIILFCIILAMLILANRLKDK